MTYRLVHVIQEESQGTVLTLAGRWILYVLTSHCHPRFVGEQLPCDSLFYPQALGRGDYDPILYEPGDNFSLWIDSLDRHKWLKEGVIFHSQSFLSMCKS